MRKLLIAVLLLAWMPAANADVYVKVDANGNAISGAIMCDAATCGAGSLYSQLTLQPGEHYALQGVGIDYGIGNNNPNTSVKVDESTQVWSVINTQTNEVTQTFTPVRVAPPVIITDTLTVDTLTVDTFTVDSFTLDSSTVNTAQFNDFINRLIKVLQSWIL